jgi:putative transposase
MGNRQRQRMSQWLNDRAEISHLPFRRRERATPRFRRGGTLQKFSSVHASFQNHLNLERHLVDRDTYKQRRLAAFAEWQTLAD